MSKLTADDLVKALVDMHELEQRLGAKGGANYDDVRKHRRESATLWERAREYVYGPPEVDNKPKNAAEKKRWQANEQRARANREPLQE